MIWVEFAGLVGSGKSTLSVRVKQRLASLGCKAYTPVEALGRTLEHDPFAQTVQRLPNGEERYIQWVSVLTSLQFSIRHPRFSWQVYRSSETRRHLPHEHRRRILRYFYRVATWYWWLGSRLEQDTYVIADEGFFHRAINLFAWSNEPLSLTRIERYIHHIPFVDLVVRVNAPLETSLERAIRRGLPSPLASRSNDLVMRFMQNSSEILDTAQKVIAEKRIPIVEVKNTGDVRGAENQILEMLVDTGLLARSGPSYSRQPAV